MHESFSLDRFAPHVGDTFWIRLSDGRVETRLVEAHPWGATGSGSSRHPFSLIFLGPGRFVLPQQTYRLEHDAPGELDLFLVPIGPAGEGGMRYEAVFS
jgi:hypothetical protein